MKIECFEPQSPVLQQYINNYYFLTNSHSEPEKSYLTFPNNYCIITVTNKCDFKFEKEKAVVTEDINQTCFSSIITNYTKPIQIQYQGNIRELTMYFKPLGINNFLSRKLKDYLDDSFKMFDPFDDYLPTMQRALETTEIEKAREIIENYWISKLISFESGFLYKAINLLEDYDKNYSIQEIADQCLTSRQNLCKAFVTHIGKTPSDYKKIHRFRKALNYYEKEKKIKTLSTLLEDSTFYDQSHFIKDFKSLTGKSPKDFFKNVDCTIGGNIKWSWI